MSTARDPDLDASLTLAAEAVERLVADDVDRTEILQHITDAQELAETTP